jgi:hypothetical protein
MNLTVTMSAHVFTSIPLVALGAIYRIYDDDYLLFEQSNIIDILEFPFRTPNQLIPITQSKNYSIEATIFGPVDGFTSGITLFQGVKKIKLIPGTNNTVQISMLYTGNYFNKFLFQRKSHFWLCLIKFIILGPKIGTTIIGTIYQQPPYQNTWPLQGLNLAILVDNQAINASQAVQFTIFDQTFPIQFTMLNLQKITANNQNIVFTVTITYFDATVIWDTITASTGILVGTLNKFNFYLARAGKIKIDFD